MNVDLTLGENIADLGGLATAYDALQSATAGEADARVRSQNFFLNWGTIWRAKVTPELQAVRSGW